MTTGARRLAVAATAALAVLAWLHLGWNVLRPALERDAWPTPGYWVAARLALEGRLDVLYDDTAFADAAAELGTVRDIFMPNPPVSLVALLPLALLDERSARNLVLATGLVAVAAAMLLLGRAARLRPLGWAALALGVAVFRPLSHSIEWGQLYPFVLLAIVVAALARAPVGRIGGGAALGVAAVTKYPFALAAAGALVVVGRLRAGLLATLVLAAGIAVSVVAWGPGPWGAWLAALGPWSDRPVHAVTALQMPRGLLTRLFERHPEFSPSPILDAPALGDALWLGFAAVVGAGTLLALWRLREVDAPALGVSIAVTAGLLVSPYVDDYTYVLALLPMFVAATELGWPESMAARRAVARAPRLAGAAASRGPLAAAAWTMLLLAAVLLGAAIPFREADPRGWESLLWYPRVYGALLLWGLLVTLAIRRRPGEAGPAVEATGSPA